MRPVNSPYNPSMGLLFPASKLKLKPLFSFKDQNLSVSSAHQQKPVTFTELHLYHGKVLKASKFAGWNWALLLIISRVVLNNLPYDNVCVILLLGFAGAGSTVTLVGRSDCEDLHGMTVKFLGFGPQSTGHQDFFYWRLHNLGHRIFDYWLWWKDWYGVELTAKSSSSLFVNPCVAFVC